MKTLSISVANCFGVPETSISLAVCPCVHMMLAGTYAVAYVMNIAAIEEAYEAKYGGVDGLNRATRSLLEHDVYTELRIHASRGIINYHIADKYSISYDGYIPMEEVEKTPKAMKNEKEAGFEIHEDGHSHPSPAKPRSMSHGFKKTALRGVRSISNMTKRTHRDREREHAKNPMPPLPTQREVLGSEDKENVSGDFGFDSATGSEANEKAEEAGMWKREARMEKRMGVILSQKEVDGEEETVLMSRKERMKGEGKESSAGRMRRIKSMGMGILRQG